MFVGHHLRFVLHLHLNLLPMNANIKTYLVHTAGGYLLMTSKQVRLNLGMVEL